MKKQLRFSKTNLLALSLALVSANAFAEGSDVYSFGGSCPSQGAYTQAALKETRRIIGIVEALKDNPDCSGMTNVVQNLKSAEEALGSDDAKAVGGEAESLPGEIDALRRMFVAGNADSTISNLLFKKTMSAAAAGSKATDVTDIAAAGIDPSAAIRAIYTRSKRVTRVGLSHVQQVFRALPSLDKCLMGRPDEEMLLMSAAVKLGAAFASSGGGVAHELGSAIAGMVELMQKRKFTRVISAAKERELWLSISCLLETSQKNYCDGENAQELMKWSRDNYRNSMRNIIAGNADPQSDNPLEGYYLLMRDLPLISQWLNKVKFGVDPKNESDAANQISAMEDVIEFQKIMKRAPGELEQGIRDMMAIPTVEARSLAVFDLLVKIEATLTKSRGGRFITQTVAEDRLPFYLVGQAIPDELVQANSTMTWEKWMKTRGPNNGLQGFFNDPVALAQTLKINVKEILVNSEANAQAFFRNRLLIDPANLVSMTLIGQNNSVKEALFHTIRYLVRLEKRLDKTSESDMTILPNIVETRERLTKIVSAYEGIIQISQGYQVGDIQTFSRNPEYTAAVLKLIDTAYDELEVLYLSDAFLTGRMYTLIDYDFSRQIRKGLNMSKHQKDLLAISQEHMVERLIQLHGLDPTPAGDDLATAQKLNRDNLYSLEQTFKTPLIKMLEELNEIVHGRDASTAGLKKVTRKRYEEDRARQRKTYYSDPWSQFVGWLSAGRDVKKKDPDLYQRMNDPNRVWGSDDRHGSVSQVWARVCVQTLAFQNRGEFYEMCKDAELKSYFGDDAQNRYLNVKYADFWPAPARSTSEVWKKGTAKRNDAIAWNRSHILSSPSLAYRAQQASDRICALNNRNIKNFVHHIQDRDRRQTATKLEDLLQSLPKPPAKPIPPKAPESSIPTQSLGPIGEVAKPIEKPSADSVVNGATNGTPANPNANSGGLNRPTRRAAG